MILNVTELSDKKIEQTNNAGIKMRLSEHAQTMVFQLFTKNVYSNPIGSVVREIASNCFDSHTEANVNLPIVIRYSEDKQANTQHISFIDYGVGISTDRMNNIYGVYFESTKRLTNSMIGGYGIGCKVPLAYKRSTGAGEGEYDNSFYVITIYNNIKYYYCIYEGADSPVISLLHEEDTTEGNGTEIRIPVLKKDLDNFAKEMIRQLYYFENIIFEGFDNIDASYNNIKVLTNDYQIIRGKSFLYRGVEYSDTMHICLGRVAYPIDYNVLGLISGDFILPIAIKLEVGDINVTVSRESIDYSETTIKLIKKKLIEAKAEIVNMLTKQYENIVTLEDYFMVKNDFGVLNFSNGKSMYVGNLIKQADVDFSNFEYNLMKFPTDKQLFNLLFTTSTFGKKIKNRWNNNSFVGGYKEIKECNDNVLYINDDFNRKILKQSYLKSEYTTYYIIKKKDIKDDKILMSDIYELFHVNINSIYDAKGKLYPIVQEILNMQDEYFEIIKKHTQDYDTLEVPESFVISRKSKNSGITNEIRNTTIPIKFHYGYTTKDRVKLNDLFKYNMPIFYGTNDDENKLYEASKLFNVLFNDNYIVRYYNSKIGVFSNDYANTIIKKTIMFIQISQSNIKYIAYCKNAFHINTFYLKMLYRKENMVNEYFAHYNLIEKYYELDKLYKDINFNKINAYWGNKIYFLNTLIYPLTVSKLLNNYNISYEKNRLSNYFDLSNIKLSKEQKELETLIKEIKTLQDNNERIFKYIVKPDYLDNIQDEHINILKLNMEF